MHELSHLTLFCKTYMFARSEFIRSLFDAAVDAVSNIFALLAQCDRWLNDLVARIACHSLFVVLLLGTISVVSCSSRLMLLSRNALSCCSSWRGMCWTCFCDDVISFFFLIALDSLTAAAATALLLHGGSGL